MNSSSPTVMDIMTTAVISVTPEMTLSQVAKILVDSQLTGVPVVDSDKQVIGLITDRDLVSHEALVHLPAMLAVLGADVVLSDPNHTNQELKDVVALTARDLMRADIPMIEESMTVTEAATVLRDSRVNPIPVVHEGAMVGIISRHDILKLLAREGS